MLSPPICSGLVEVRIVPGPRQLATWVPLTYSRSVVPSYVSARCVQVFSGSAAARTTSRIASIRSVPPAAGRPCRSWSPQGSSCRCPCRSRRATRWSPSGIDPRLERHRRRQMQRRRVGNRHQRIRSVEHQRAAVLAGCRPRRVRDGPDVPVARDVRDGRAGAFVERVRRDEFGSVGRCRHGRDVRVRPEVSGGILALTM